MAGYRVIVSLKPGVARPHLHLSSSLTHLDITTITTAHLKSSQVWPLSSRCERRDLPNNDYVVMLPTRDVLISNTSGLACLVLAWLGLVFTVLLFL
ncbi:hypothetical protein E2C01_088603 [Portunus trituberculatus]|uniref:Uncharacterized protein n=1 Tax=Portunus trituberculatus TaxID=210409 RepID=A0A5B7JFW4_PORTR|nr:hypothetical protein [Portunus trituberculatus]